MSKLANEGERPIVTVGNIADISPHNKAIYESGKTLLIESINTGREFCKFMITMSTGAIPIYLSILTFLLPKDYKLGVGRSIVAVLPPIAFLISSIIFTVGYFPVRTEFSLDVIEEIEKAREDTIRRRTSLIRVGFSIFIIAALASIGVIIASLNLR